MFAAILFREKIALRSLLALVVASLGVVSVIDPCTTHLSTSLFPGNLSLVAAALTWALYSVLVRQVTRNTDVLSTSQIAFAGGLPICLPLGIWEMIMHRFGVITPCVIGGIVFLGVLSTALAMYLWNTAFATLSAGVASLTFFA